MAEPTHVLVVAPNWLGDAVMALPALADVRRAYPHARLAVTARPSVAPLYSMVPGVDATIVTNWRGSFTRRRALQEDLQQIAAEQVDRAILFPNSFASAWTVHRARVKERWGYAADLRRPLLTRAIRRPRGSLHQGAYYQYLVRELGIATGALEPVLTVPASAIAEARALLIARGWDGSRPLMVAAPGAAYGTAKRWLPRHFGSLVTRAVRAAGVHCVLVGTSADGDSARLVLESTGAAERVGVFDLTGATTLQVLAGVMSLAAVCVSNDSGAMHLAGAVGTPLAALFGPTRDRETAPLTRHGGRAEVLINQIWCRPCMLRECPFEHQCMSGLKPERVFESVRLLMGDSLMTTPAVFLDRDGTLIEERGYLDRLELLSVFPWTADALRLLKRAGYTLVVVTNQSAIARGVIDEAFLAQVHQELSARLARGGASIDRYYHCPHLSDAPIERYRQACRCRKPGPGMIEQACRDMALDPARSFMIGDRWLDVACGVAAGTRALRVRTGHGAAEDTTPPADVKASAILNNLMEAAGWILRNSPR